MKQNEYIQGPLEISFEVGAENQNTDITKTMSDVQKQELSNTLRKKLIDIFNKFADQNVGFNKTQISIAQVFPDDYPMSRSEARRLTQSIARFGEVELDFSNVENLGQAFTHELFVVFANDHPDIKLNRTHCGAAVNSMINRVLNS